ncbi:MAG: DUF6527 family protein [Puia sp.]|nr:DUF6527 family protein [Puia sp.]
MKKRKFERKDNGKGAKKPSQPFYQSPHFVESFVDVPDRFEKNELYIVERNRKRKWLMLMCPNDCGRRLELNLMDSKMPCWKVVVRQKKVTVYPSIVAERCGAHFWIERSEIIWSHVNGDTLF